MHGISHATSKQTRMVYSVFSSIHVDPFHAEFMRLRDRKKTVPNEKNTQHSECMNWWTFPETTWKHRHMDMSLRDSHTSMSNDRMERVHCPVVHFSRWTAGSQCAQRATFGGTHRDQDVVSRPASSSHVRASTF